MTDIKNKQEFFKPPFIVEHLERIKTTTQVIHGKFQDVCKDFADESINTIITDPPYDKPSLYLYSDLAKLASRILKPGGFCVMHCGNMYLEEIKNSLRGNLNYVWSYISLISPAPFSRWPILLTGSYRMILIYSKGNSFDSRKYRGTDTIKSRREKSDHKMQQCLGVVKHLVKYFTEINDTILDPFIGSGTTAIACKHLGRNCVGIDIDEECIKLTKDKLKQNILF